MITIHSSNDTGTHGGVCMYIKESIKTKRLQELEDPAIKVLWSYIRPPRLPRGINCVVTACIYHPPGSNDTEILEYLSDVITRAEGLFPGCGIIIAGNFNQLDTKHLCRDFRLKNNLSTNQHAVLTISI